MHFWRSVCSGIKYIWKIINLVREVILNLLFLFIALAIIGLFSNFDSTNIRDQNGILVVDLEGSIVDSVSLDDDFYKLTKKLNNDGPDLTRQNSLFQLTQKIDQATNDPGIKGIVLKLDNFTGGNLASLQYVAKYLKEFKKSGKKIYAIGGYFDQKQYYLASIADRIYMVNQGSVSLYGFSTNNLYYKSLLENLKIDTHVFRVGTYKSAIEPFIRDDMSDSARKNTTRWLTSMWNNYLYDIATNRNTSPDNLVPSPDVMLSRLKAASGSIGDYALDNKIVDYVMSYPQATQAIDTIFSHQPEISIYDYKLYPTRMPRFTPDKSTENPLIAVIFVDGTITTGQSSNNIAGSDSIVNKIKEIKNNHNVRAVVLRVNSPGGSVYASEAIRSELATLRANDIPIVVSMGGMAASGGYWISTEGDYIIANQNTITGSIGIFGIVNTFEKTLSKIGVYTDGVSTSPLADATITKTLPKEVSQMIQMNIENGYDTFLNIVAKSRNMTYEDVDRVAQGQVWLGEEALKMGLVDELGDFDNAVEKAASLAGLNNYTIVWPQENQSFFNELFSGYSVLLPTSLAEILYSQLPLSDQIKNHVAFWDNLNDPQSRYIYCLNCSDIK